MDEELFGFGHYFRVLAEERAAGADGGAEPRVGLVDFPVEDEGVDDAEGEFDDDPQVVGTGVPGKSHLDDGLDNGGGLEVGGDYVVALVGSEEVLAVVDEVADE